MKIANLKVTDGDLLVISVGANTPQAIIESIRAKIKKWCTDRGISNVELIVTTIDVHITKMTVNDVVEDSLLKGKDEN